MTNLIEVLGKLSKAKDRSQLSMLWHAYFRESVKRKDKETLWVLFSLRDITNNWNIGYRGRSKKWR